MTAHPSFMALDTLALGCPVSREVEEHVATCGQCAAHVQRVQGAGVELPPRRAAPARTEPPAVGAAKLTGALSVTRPAQAGSRARMRTGWRAGGAALVAAASLMVALITMRPESVPDRGLTEEPGVATRAATEPVSTQAGAAIPPFTTVRGAPSAGLYVRRHAHTALWDGRTPLQAGDALRIRVAPEGYTRVTVFLRESDDTWVLLYESEIPPTGTQLLPRAWELDGQNEDERIVTVLSHEAVDESLGRAALAGQHPTLWAREYALRPSTMESP